MPTHFNRKILIAIVTQMGSHNKRHLIGLSTSMKIIIIIYRQTLQMILLYMISLALHKSKGIFWWNQYSSWDLLGDHLGIPPEIEFQIVRDVFSRRWMNLEKLNFLLFSPRKNFAKKTSCWWTCNDESIFVETLFQLHVTNISTLIWTEEALVKMLILALAKGLRRRFLLSGYAQNRL